MKHVTISLDNCYGIKSLHAQFDFSSESVYAIYAPNGAMKSSLAQTFDDVSKAVPSTDRIFPTRATSRKIIDEHGADLMKESVLVVFPYDAEFGPSEKTSTLLVDSTLRREYEQLHVEIDKSKELLLNALKDQSHSRKALDKEISSAFTSSANEFYTALVRIKEELSTQKEAPFADVYYDKIFDDKVLAALQTKNVKTALEGYVKRYNELLAASTYFKKGTFDYYNASQIAKSLGDNGFFSAKHTVNLNAAERLEISTQKELEEVIAKEKERIIEDKALRKQFDEIAKLLEKNVTLRDFQNYMLEHEALLSQLTNINKFKEDIWKSYLKAQYALYSDLMNKFEAAAKRKKLIEDEAAKQRTQWEEVIQIFNDRFVVPFKLSAKNRTAVMLGYAPIVELGFTYFDGMDNIAVDKAALLKSLSTGEKKALYVLNVIFEIEARRKAQQETLLVIDDLADSFDYQNKYAIIQYLRDINEDRLFKQIIMTHNFDFFRTIESRFVNYHNCLMVSKNKDGIIFEQATGIRNVFVNDWKPNFFSDRKKKIASIPFLRNLVEYTRGESDPNFLKLTSLLHWKPDSSAIVESDLDAIYKAVCGESGASANGSESVVDIIQAEAKSCLTSKPGINFENKIVLAIAIRIAAERFMIDRIGDTQFVNGIKFHQTQRLLSKFKDLFPGDTRALEILDRVMLMTPENIHLNSFMYEPIVDMSDEHLRKLYQDAQSLKLLVGS